MLHLGSMKFDVNLNDARALRKAKAELSRLLTIIDFALSKIEPANRNGHDRTLPLELTRNALDILASEKPILDIVNRLPDQFTTSDVIIALGDEGKEKRNAVKFTLSREVERKHLNLLVKGQGRRPSKYMKVVESIL